jgi:hypothetical protein
VDFRQDHENASQSSARVANQAGHRALGLLIIVIVVLLLSRSDRGLGRRH